MRLAAALALVMVLTGCTRATAGTPVAEPQHLDCDLIFPGPSPAT